MSKLFKRALCFSDIHFGLKNNSRIHNNDCEDFVNWFCDIAKELNCETALFLGDWSHHRNTVNVSTLNYTVSNLQKLNDSFEQVFIIAGNHDLYYREKREIHSLPMATKFPNITMINSPFIKDDVAILPWLVGDEWKDVTKIKTKYLFGHFELPGFKMNAMVEMPDHGTLNHTHFKNQDYVFSGHFHKRQVNRNIHYIGNPFGHNYADAWDFERGAMFLEWDQEPQYINYESGPKYVTTSLSKIAEDPDRYLLEKAYIKAVIDVNLTYEEVNFMRETFTEMYPIRELSLVPERNTEFKEDNNTEIKFESIDEIVADQLSNIESEEFDKAVLLQIYNSL